MINRYSIVDSVARNNTKYKHLKTEENPSPILNIFRLISGTVNIKDNYQDKTYKIRDNNIKFPTELNTSLKYDTFLEQFDESVSLEDLNYFFLKARSNRKFYKSIEVELIKCLIAYKNDNFLESFIYLYRIIEGISYSIPLIFVSKKDDYNKTYHDLQSYFGKDKDGELLFFKRFVSETFKDEDFYNSNITIDLNLVDIEELRPKYYELYLKKVNEKFVLDKSENSFIKIKFIGYYDLLIELRNRFFHNLKGSWQENFDSIELMFPDQFFKPITLHGINWLSIILFEIIKFDLQKIK
ncbi:hypothetical protein EGY05_18335 [Chryseobacterium arthrosphaerae]|uniref:hypothetical protein n=1 Tax=Chryseobacterium arthrosphaerae TaxID=651561 RepID=UPI000F4E25D9|nr:hypothetical protein [Chryseobacterium arthrosphaerae]AYZ13778.1 hypothetical protein EGY05_18335 [Chryseobacterium arthrosphaerae]